MRRRHALDAIDPEPRTLVRSEELAVGAAIDEQLLYPGHGRGLSRA